MAAADAGAGRVVGTVHVTEPNGKPASTADVVVYVVGFTEPPAKVGAAAAEITQKNRKFQPDLVAITVGETVAFPNSDAFFHNVFSLSAARKFDLGSFRHGETKAKDFPTPGVVDVYCNIHPEMAATILVLPNRRHTKAAPDGSFVLDGVPAGTWTVFAYARRATKPVAARVTVAADADTKIDLSLTRGPEPAHLNKYGEQYRDDDSHEYH
ncbi:MAG TPA: hypothetical protein VGM88_19560 [Kofleriaceae bacterium]